MADMMTFSDTVEEFMEQYKITDTEHIYTNGTELVPIFRMKQWFDHKLQLKYNHPHWIISSDGYYPYCSECKSEPKNGEMTDFCPNCGADMRGGERE